MIEKARPEDIGISPNAITKALDDIDRKKVPIHSLLMMRHGKIFLEAYWAPWTADKLHRLYSITKSFTALLIGCLEEEGKLSLDDRIVDYFPEYCPEDIHPYLASLTIRDMLMMRTCHRKTTYKEGGRGNFVPSFRKDWVRSFFQVAPDHEPGAFFIYDTSSPHVLGALCEKLTEKKLIAYLREKLFDALGVSDDTYFVLDPEGIPVGGSGLMIRPIDLLSVMDLIREGGRDIINADYLSEATAALSETETGSSGLEADRKCGYGYQFWRMSHNAYAMVGLGGQFAIAVPDKDMTIVTTADTQMNSGWDQDIMRAIWMIVDSVTEDSIPEDKVGTVRLSMMIPGLRIPVSKGKASPSEYYGKEFAFGENMLSLSSLSFTADSFRMTVRGTLYSFSYISGENSENAFPVATMSPCYASGGWLSDGTFALYVQFSGEEEGTLRIQLGFKGERVSVIMHLNGEISLEGFEGVASGAIRK